MTTEGNSFIGYTLTGRSSSSQARKISLWWISFND
jgi:hypothetical protein